MRIEKGGRGSVVAAAAAVSAAEAAVVMGGVGGGCGCGEGGYGGGREAWRLQLVRWLRRLWRLRRAATSVVITAAATTEA